MSTIHNDHYFLKGGGEMGELIRAKDWSKTPLGHPKDWPQSLRTMVSVMLDNPFGMYIAWGKEYTQIYNDGYRPILGSTKHPQALGLSTRETFVEIWHIIESMFDGVMNGIPVGFPDFMLPLNRNGFIETCYFDFAHSPIRMDNGEVGGVLVTVIETTNKKKAEDELKESKNQLEFTIDAAQLGTFDYNPVTNKFSANDRLKEWFGLPSNEQIELTDAINAISENDQEKVSDAIKATLEFKSGGKLDVIYTIINPITKRETIVHAKGRAWFNNQKVAFRLNGTLEDVTEQMVAQRKTIQSEQIIRNMVLEAPIGICVMDAHTLVSEIVNERFVEIAGKPYKDIVGRPYWDTFLEAKPYYEDALNTVVQSGIPYYANEVGIMLIRHGKEETIYVTFVYAPLKDEQGEVTKIAVWVVDNTSQVVARQKVAQSESNLKLMILQAPVAIAILRGLDYKVEIVNKHALELWGRTEQQVLGKPVFVSMPELLTQGIKELLDEVMNTGNRFVTAELPVQLLRKNILETIYINFSYEPLYDETGNINGIMTVGIDVTPQVSIRKKVEESEKRYNLMLMQSPFAFLILKGKDMMVQLANNSMKEVLGKGANIEGKPLLEVLPEFKNQAFLALLDSVYSTGIPFSANEILVQLTRNGRLEDVYLNYVYQPYYEADNTISGVTVIAYDVTSSVIANKKIEASEERLNIVVEASQLGTWELNLKTKEPIYSKRYLEIIGGYKEDIKLNHSQLLKHLHPDDHLIREKAFKEVFETGYLHYQARLIWNDKSIHWMEGRGKLFYDEENKPLKLIGTIRDITEEKNHEEELKKSEEQFSTLADNMENLAWLADGEGWIYWYNKRWLEYTGHTLEEMQGWGWQKVHHPDHVERVLEISKKIWHVNETFELTFPLRRHDGVYKWFLTRGYPVTNEDGKIIRWIGTNTDISKQKEAEDQFRQMAERMPQKVWTADANGNRNYFNQVMIDYTGLTFDELKDWGWKKIIHPDDWPKTMQLWEHSINTGDDFEKENRILRYDGKYLWHLIRATAVKDELGRPKMWIGSKTEIHDQIELSESLGENLKRSNEQMQTILQHAPDAVISIDEDGIIRSWNPEAETIFGWKESDVIGKTLTETIIPERYRSGHKKGIKHFLRTGEGPAINKPIELSAIRKEGNEFPVELKISASKVNDRYIFIGFVRDITIRKKAEETIQNKTNQLMEAQQLAHIGSWEWDVSSNKIEWSDELYRIYGLTPQELEADYETYLKYIHPDDRTYANEIVQQALKDHQPFRFFHRIINGDGKERIISSTGKVFIDKAGKVIKMSGTAQDVTDQKNYEERLKISEERFYKIFDNNPVPMSLSEIKTNKIKYANILFYNVFGYTSGEVIGNTSEELNLIDAEEHKRVVNKIFELLHENRTLAEIQALSKEDTEALLLKLKQSEEMKNFEILYTRKNGEKFPALVSFELIKIGTETYTVSSYQDITERKKSEAQLKAQNDQLEKMNKELQSFTYVSSHDLQEPLRKIQTFASQIVERESKNLSDDGKDKFQRMNNAAHRMQILIQDLLAYSRATTQERKLETINLEKIIDGVKEDLREELHEKNALVETSAMLEIKIVPFQFRQLFINLIGNSLKFSIKDRSPHIKITCERETGVIFDNKKLSSELTYCHIQYTDNGIGFENEYSERIFEVFQRVHEKDKFQGTGIGLAIVKKIVENHQGIIAAQGEINKGARFDIYIPIE